jgi:hypothetical protein
VAALGLAAAGAIAYQGARAASNYSGGKLAVSALPIVTLPKAPVGVYGVVNDDGELTAAAVVVLDVDGTGGTIVPVPVSADVAGGFGTDRITLRDAFASAGAVGLRNAIDNGLALTTSSVQVDTPDEAEVRFGSVGAARADLPDDVVVRDDEDDDAEVVIEAGPQALTAAEIVTVLTARDVTLPDLARLANLAVAWQGVADAIGVGRGPAGDGDPDADFDALWASVIAGPVQSRVLPTQPVPAENNPDGVDAVILEPAETTMVFASIAPRSVSAFQLGLTYHVQAPPGSEAAVVRLISQILFVQGNVKVVTFDAPAQTQSDIIVYDDNDRDQVATDNSILGEVAYPEPTRILDGVQVTIVVGSDYLSR